MKVPRHHPSPLPLPRMRFSPVHDPPPHLTPPPPLPPVRAYITFSSRLPRTLCFFPSLCPFFPGPRSVPRPPLPPPKGGSGPLAVRSALGPPAAAAPRRAPPPFYPPLCRPVPPASPTQLTLTCSPAHPLKTKTAPPAFFLCSSAGPQRPGFIVWAGCSLARSPHPSLLFTPPLAAPRSIRLPSSLPPPPPPPPFLFSPFSGRSVHRAAIEHSLRALPPAIIITARANAAPGRRRMIRVPSPRPTRSSCLALPFFPGAPCPGSPHRRLTAGSYVKNTNTPLRREVVRQAFSLYGAGGGGRQLAVRAAVGGAALVACRLQEGWGPSTPARVD